MSYFGSTNFYFEVGEHNIPGVDYIHKFGRNPDIDVGSFEVVWNGGGDYTGFDATVAENIETFSSSTSDVGTLVSSGSVTGGSKTTLEDTGATFVTDGVAIGDALLIDEATNIMHSIVTEVTSETELTVVHFDKGGGTFSGTPEVGDSYRVATAASTGAAVLHIQLLLDGDLSNETEEFVILNGTTAVDTVGTYRRNSRATVVITGSNNSNVGSITSRQKTTTANIFSVVPIGYNHSMIAVYTIPTDKEGHLLAWYASLAGKVNANCNIQLLVRHVNEVFVVLEEFSISGSGNSYVNRKYLVPKNALSPGSDIKILVDTDTNNTAIAAGFDLILSID